MGVRVTRRARLPERIWDAEASRELAAAAVEAIDARAFGTGLDVNDAPFAPYSADYRSQLRQAGDSTRVDLTRSGALRRGLARCVARADRRLVVLRLPADVAARAAGVQRTRPFFALSSSDRARVARELPDILRRAIDRGRRP